MSSRFVKSNELHQIDLGDGDWVKVPSRFSYGFIQDFNEAQGSDTQKVASFLLKMIKQWNLKDGDDIAPIDQEHLEALDVTTFQTIMEEVIKLITIPKVERPESGKPSEATDGTVLS